MVAWNTDTKQEKTKAVRPPIFTMTIVLFTILVVIVAIASLISSIGGY